VFGGGAAVGVLPGKFDFLPTKEQEGLVKKRGDQLLVAASPIDQVPENKIGALLVILVCRFWGLYIYIYSLDLTNSSCAGQNWPGKAFPEIVNFAKISSWYSNNWIQLPHPHPSFQIICTTIIDFCLCKFGKVG
jgi:hypothetical protein